MPPALFVATSSAVAVGLEIELDIPPTSKVGDTLLAIVARKTTDSAPATPDDWTAEATFVGATHTLHVFRRARVEGQSSRVAFTFTALANPALGVVVVYRNLNAGAAIVASDSTAIAASTNFVCPSLALTTYSDLYVGIVFVSTAAVAVNNPSGGFVTHERIEYQASGRTLEVFDYLKEATGASGTKTAIAATAQTGIAAALLLAADAVQGAGLSFSFDPIGAIGLPSRGV